MLRFFSILFIGIFTICFFSHATTKDTKLAHGTLVKVNTEKAPSHHSLPTKKSTRISREAMDFSCYFELMIDTRGEILEMIEDMTRSGHSSVSQAARDRNAQISSTLRTFIARIEEGNFSLESLLEYLLQERLRGLYQNTCDLQGYLGEKNRDKFTIPSVNTLFNALSDRSAPLNKRVQEKSNLLYTLFLTLIKDVYKAADPLCFSENTIKLLFFSPQLKSFLEDRCSASDISCDVCGGWAPIKKLYDLVRPKLRGKNNMAGVMAKYAWPAYNDPMILRDTLWDAERLEYLRFRQGCDGEIFRAFTVQVNRIIRKDLTLGTPNLEEMLMYGLEAYDPSWGALLLDLETSQQDAAQRRAERNSALASIADVPSHPTEEGSPANKSAERQGEDSALASIADVPTESRKAEKKGRDTATASMAGAPAYSKKQRNTTESRKAEKKGRDTATASMASAPAYSKKERETTDSRKAGKKEKDTATASMASAPAYSRDTDSFVDSIFTYPKGVRNKVEILVSEPPMEASPSLQKFIDTLFDPQQCVGLTYDNIKTYWESIGGRMSGKKGSHRVFITPHNQKLWGTFDHGGYGKRTIRYPQAAFWFLGYRPSA